MPELFGRDEHSPQTGDVQVQLDPGLPEDAGSQQEWHSPTRGHPAGVHPDWLYKQMVYVTPNVTRLFLSREACSDLGIIPPQFPSTSVGAITGISLPQQPKPAPQVMVRKCRCPTCSLPPQGPIPLPVPATEANRDTLEQHLRTVLKASTFNTCTHQTLPMMAGPPLRLNIDLEATPVAAHKAASIPVHWEATVKEHLDRDVRLGVIEKVPIGTPDTWCHRMMIVGKSNSEPRRVIDFQPLNAHATRETHHTRSPYHQARGVPKLMKKSVFDAWNGYHSVPLHPDDTHFTTFITPWGRYRYLTGTRLLETVTPHDSIASSKMSRTRQSVWTTL